jgi:NHL repeat
LKAIGVKLQGLLAFAAFGFALLLLPPVADADMTFCDAGSNAGECSSPTGVAVDWEMGTVYVADSGNRRVDVFEADGSFVRAFGWDVIPAGQPGDTGSGLEACTAATTCQAGSLGAGAGQLGSGPHALAVDNDPASSSLHSLYVADLGNRRVQKFTPLGEFVLTFGDGVNKGPNHPGDICTATHIEEGDTCGAGANGKGQGQFFSFGGFRPILVGVGPGGVVHVGDGPSKGEAESEGFDNRVQRFEANGSFIDEIPLPEMTQTELSAFAVDQLSGEFYAAARARPGPHKYDASGNHVSIIPNPPGHDLVYALAVDQNGDLFVADRTPPPRDLLGGIYQYDSTGTPIRTFYGNGTLKTGPVSIAPYSSTTGNIFVVEDSSPRRLAHIAFPPPGPVILPFAAKVGDSEFLTQNSDTKALPVGNVRATFNTRVNPEGKATDVYFEYVEDTDYQQDVDAGGDGFEGPNTLKTDPTETVPSPIPPDTIKWVFHDASHDLACPDPETEFPEGKCLEPETEYHLRAVAKNADGEVTGPESTFETKPPIQLGEAWSTDVGSDSARLHAEINPTGLAASAHFEYVEETAYLNDLEEGGDGFAASTSTPELDFGAGSTVEKRSVLIGSLKPDATYRYRYIATNLFGEFASPERSLTTPPPSAFLSLPCPNQAFRGGASAALPGCRAYEMVSPLDKNSGDIVSLEELASGPSADAHVNQATPEGDAFTYSSFRAFAGAASSPYSSQYLARRNSKNGWSSHSLNPPLGGNSLYGGVYTQSLFKGFSDDLCSGWFLQNTDLALVPGAPAGVPGLYRRHNCGGEPYELVSTVPPPGFSKEGEDEGSDYHPAIGGWSKDGLLSIFKAPAALTPEASTVGIGVKLDCFPQEGAGVTSVFQWLRNGTSIGGAGEGSYTTEAADAGKAIQCRVRATNVEKDENSSGKVGAIHVSDPALIVAPPPATRPPVAPGFIAAPQTSAPLEVGGPGGQTLTCDPREDDWKGSPTSFAYQWYRNGFLIVGASASTYVVKASDLVGAAAVQCVVTAANDGGGVSKASANLTTTGPAPEPPAPKARAFVLDIYRVYAHHAGELALVSVLPNGEMARTHSSVGTRQDAADRRFFDRVAGAVSEDGMRIFWSAESKEPPKPVHVGQAVEGGEGPSKLYLRINPMEEQSAVSGGKCTEPGKACTIAVSIGEARFIAAGPQATKALFSEGGDLYELDVDKAIEEGSAGGAKILIAEEVKGILGTSGDLARTYFVSTEVCSGEAANSEGEEAQVGQPNLYLYEAGQSCGAGELTFVATLPNADLAEDFGISPVAGKPLRRRGRVSRDGMHAVFMSIGRLTDYDNTDASSGKADAEVFLYDAAAGELRCVSCNPSGARPQGRQLSTGGWGAAQIPGWETHWHPSRVLSEDGSLLFFESFEGLVTRDTNGKQDVYEWREAQSKEDCEKAGADRYVPASEGCLSLISSGKSEVDSEFLDASASGSDVFFITASSLVPADYGLIDVYDARVNGGFEEGDNGGGPICQGEACQIPSAPPAVQTPSSSAFRGPGNRSPRRPCGKGKRRVNRGGKARCVKKHQTKRKNGRARR